MTPHCPGNRVYIFPPFPRHHSSSPTRSLELAQLAMGFSNPLFFLFLPTYPEVLFSHFTFGFGFSFLYPLRPRIPFLCFEFSYFSLISLGFVTGLGGEGFALYSPAGTPSRG